MGFLDGLLGSPKRDTLPSGVTVRHFRTAYKDRLLAHFDAAFPGRETLLWDDETTGIELAVMKPTAAEPFYVAYTIGMSAEPMNLDDMPKKRQYEWLRWAELVEGYFAAGRDLRLVVQIADMRHDPTRDDLHMLEFLSSGDFPFLLAATKSDKLSRMKVKERTRAVANAFGLGADNVIATSGATGAGKDVLLARIGQVCAPPAEYGEDKGF